jgi:hypothetical protein
VTERNEKCISIVNTKQGCQALKNKMAKFDHKQFQKGPNSEIRKKRQKGQKSQIFK